jgi:hypothetical protein
VGACGAGLLASWEIFAVTGNPLESALSGLSLVLTATDDYLDDGQLGESTFTSAITFLAGGINPDPIVDLAIDGYASGYNHGFFNGINDILFGAPIIIQDPTYK